MRAVEIITVYLACAAPVGVARYLRLTEVAGRARRLASAAAAGLLWPLTLLAHFITRKREARGLNAMKKFQAPHESAYERAERTLIDALHGLEDEALEACGIGHAGPTAEAARSARATVERYSGLNLPARVSGRAGDDLEIAGRCLHRRNVARLEAHRLSARVELLHALADLPDTFAASLLASPSDFRASRRLFAALLPVYSRAVELLRQDGDARGVQTVARLFDESCARLRRLEAFDRPDAHDAPEGDETCTPHDSQPTAPQLPLPQHDSTATTVTRA
jgi:hypothetical protein